MLDELFNVKNLLVITVNAPTWLFNKFPVLFSNANFQLSFSMNEKGVEVVGSVKNALSDLKIAGLLDGKRYNQNELVVIGSKGIEIDKEILLGVVSKGCRADH